MKKFVIATACVTVLGLVAVGVQQFSASADDAHQSGSNLNVEEAKQQIQTQYPGEVTEIERERENGKDVYEMEIVGEEYKYELKLDAASGDVLKLDEKEKIRTSKQRETDQNSQNETSSTDDANESSSLQSRFAISIEEAKQIALNEVGGTIDEIERDEDDGMFYYEVELHTERGEAEVEVDAQTGEIIVISYDD
ncbi:Uncharacterized membrane protein YkoI [Alteribacillus persepolensis]|uniref:Uncharacterized membrane protein YkoI n=1 Tax=Alteribacillus persepolensis TaxID=568899 RepID=A0A1G8ETK6_9BACI|nr:PepSY domain-containing protein [Alteribacillus persepolensis]SDH73228.1 Uncharacterized membrane protein YkoI [Alteribacillus persepolensis]